MTKVLLVQGEVLSCQCDEGSENAASVVALPVKKGNEEAVIQVMVLGDSDVSVRLRATGVEDIVAVMDTALVVVMPPCR